MLKTSQLSHTALAVAMLSAVAFVPTGAIAQQVAAADTAAATPAQADEIIVLGTRRTDRTLTTSASPVDVISASELKTQPAANMLEVLKNIVPSFFVGQNTISDASSFVRAPSLRGLPADEILVMLDGKRYNRSALVQVYSGGDTGLSYGSQGSDLSAIPSIAIKSLQILREGATAQYGSDAIAGVLNYGLRDNKTGFEAIARYGQYYDHGDGKSKQISANLGLSLGERGFVNLSGEYDDDGQTSRGATRPLALVFAQQNPSLASQLPNYPGPVQIWGSSPSHGWKAVINSGYEVTDNSKLYFFGNAARSKANESFNYRSPISGTAVDVTGATQSLGANGALSRVFYLTPCPAGNATCPAGGFVSNGNTFSVKSIYPAGFTPRFVGTTEELIGTVGYKGKTPGGFTYDFSATTSRNSLDLSMYNSISPTYGPASQTAFKFGDLIQKETDANIDLSQPVNIGLYSPLTISAGAEYRRESYTATPGDPQSYGAGPYTASQNLYLNNGGGIYTPNGTSGGSSPGASGYGGTDPAAAGSHSQSSYGIYGDLETDIVKALSVGIAGRYEHYNTFGGAFVYKANAIYKFSDAFSLRGTVGSGFHAPSPGQSNTQILTTNFIGGNQVQTGTYPTTSPIAQYYGAKQLTPEKSYNYGVGFIATPVHNLTLTVDAYSIKVKNRIFITQNFTVTPADIIAQPALLSVGAGGAITYFTNGLDTVTKGIDFVATYRAALIEPGDLNLTLAYNYNTSRVSRADANVLSANQILDISHLAPNHRATLSAAWSHDKFSVNARENFYGDWIDSNDYPVFNSAGKLVGQKFGSKFTTDLDVGYDLTKYLTLSVGGSNIFNIKPDRIANSPANTVYAATGSTADGQIYPRSGGPFGINGGLWYVRARVAF
ncbi:TonB-dependent receptor plug domain-containing protein [Glacieibacterium megasporae]|uniref:TonB-dependent receptor plug domain-containing protein n=1 Tax=Glacieibacterium megasporae TaxID=2835787 RepID=UPI001C1E7F47|nr:TonB-dependent receptor [Polymorphobacter megasporae]UAJ09695.1 TonB-dependent receptor [Polymorphobacter megasporae]